MPSPFPGMNPYLEQNDSGEDFHTNFLTRPQEILSGKVGDRCLVKIEVRLIPHELSADERRFLGRGDLAVTTGERARETADSVGALTAPMVLQLPAVEVERHASLEIRDRRNRRVVTVVELLSTSNKSPGEDRDDYVAKRRQILAGQTNLVEIDLRRGGTRPSPPDLPACDYYALVSRYEDRPRLGFWPIGLRDPLPDLPIPLDAPDPPVSLDLKAVLDRAYDAVNYGKYILQETPEPPLSAADEAWARAMIR